MKLIHVRQAQNHMATTFEFVISCDQERLAAADQTMRESHALVAQLERELSEFLLESPIYQLNHATSQTKIFLPQSALELLELSDKISQSSDGFFDCAAKSQTADRPQFEWNVDEGTAWKLFDGARIGFGAIGKGYALDNVRSLLEREGFQDFYLNAGGSSLIMSGFSAPNDPWRWGWSWQKDGTGEAMGRPFAHTTGIPVAVGVSGLHEKGQHLLEPHTGQAATHAQTALVAHPTATEADALSTALFVSGWEKANAFMQNFLTRPAMAFIDRDGGVQWNGTFQRLWGSVIGLAFIFATSIARAADDAINLNDLGVDDFTPYVIDRNRWWILLPLASLAVVFIHLKKIHIRTRPQPTQPEDK